MKPVAAIPGGTSACGPAGEGAGSDPATVQRAQVPAGGYQSVSSKLGLGQPELWAVFHRHSNLGGGALNLGRAALDLGGAALQCSAKDAGNATASAAEVPRGLKQPLAGKLVMNGLRPARKSFLIYHNLVRQSFRLNLNRVRDLNDLRATDHYLLPVRGITREDSGLRPVEVPAVFNRDHRIRARNHLMKDEGAVEIALIAAKEVAVCIRVFGDQNDHGASSAFAGPLCNAAYVCGTPGNR